MKTRKTAAALMGTLALLALTVPAFASRMDDRIESSARKSYVFQTYLQGDEIKVQSRDGAVSLTGLVSERSHKALARETVVGLPGVKSVEDRLEVRGAPQAENSDGWLRDKVKGTLLLHRSVRGTSTEVEVKDGNVTLRGEAESRAQKELTTEYAKDVEGVRDVRNEMSVAEHPKKGRTAGEKIDDASITSQVKMTLLYHRSSSAIHTEVTTKRGVVTLTGKASSEAQLNLASKLAGDVRGVREVRNRMSVL
jgi:hyperosmotically inducible periplasmic protein